MEALNNNFGYRGIVSLKRNFKGRTLQTTIYNEGTSNLFKLLCKALCGYSIAADVPAYFKIVDGNGRNLLNREIGLSSPSYVDENGVWRARFLINITNRDISQSIENARKMIICNSRGDELAYINVNGEEFIADNNQTLIIQWDMLFENAEKSDIFDENNGEVVGNESKD